VAVGGIVVAVGGTVVAVAVGGCDLCVAVGGMRGGACVGRDVAVGSTGTIAGGGVGEYAIGSFWTSG
jgi:hypothetical protein